MVVTVPRHIAIIPDGNRRWMRQHKIGLMQGYDKGIRKIGDVLKWCKEREVHTLSMWGFSTDNAKRDRDEIDKLFGLFKKYLYEIIEESRKKGEDARKKYDVRIRFLGRRSLFPREIKEAMEQIERLTASNKTYQLNILLGYGGREEIVDAVNRIIASGVREADEKMLSDSLYSAGIEDPDLVIRTSGEQRLSGFMPYQCVYSELFFVKALWPDFSKKDFDRVLRMYDRRKRRFGK